MVSLLHETSLCACFTAGITSGSIRRGCIRSPRSQGSRLPSFACILGELLLLCSDPYRVIHCPRLSLLHPPKSFHKMVRSQPNNPTTSPPPPDTLSVCRRRVRHQALSIIYGKHYIFQLLPLSLRRNEETSKNGVPPVPAVIY